ncbi:MAG: cyclase family protein [Myxococcota bacterium]|nr:cyclase family protein [Myxococcota bacterium]
MTKLIDISPVLSSATAVWPGDVPFSRAVALDMKKGDNLTLSAITTTLHIGAHADAPSHYGRHGAAIGERDLELYYGACDVVHVNVARGERISSSHLAGARITSPRVLLKTGTFPDPNVFNTDFASLSPELVDYLAARGVRLIGIDTPSVDPFADRELLAHNAVQFHDMAVLEAIVLAHVAAGAYTLIALPLRLAEGDASPVRAALLPAQ